MPSATLNLRGRACLLLHSAGLAESASYDSQGHPLMTSRKLAAAFTDEPDWTLAACSGTPSQLLAQAAPLLETETFSKAFAYDARGRVTSAHPAGSERAPADV